MPYLAYPRCFLSASFDPLDQEVFKWFKQLLEALDFEVVTGEDPEPRPPLETIRNRIESCSAIVGVLTKRDRVEGTSRWKPPQSVFEEIAMAYALGKTVAVLVEKDVETGGMTPEATTYVPWTRSNLPESVPVIVRYLVNLRSKLSPAFHLEGDIPTARALASELSGISSELESVAETLDLSSWHLAALTATVSGKLLTLPQPLLAEVQRAYAALTPVTETLRMIQDARQKLRPGGFSFLMGEEAPPLPALHSDHPLLTQLSAERAEALPKVRRTVLLLFRFGWPAEWKSTVYPALRESLNPEEFKGRFGIVPEELD